MLKKITTIIILSIALCLITGCMNTVQPSPGPSPEPSPTAAPTPEPAPTPVPVIMFNIMNSSPYVIYQLDISREINADEPASLLGSDVLQIGGIADIGLIKPDDDEYEMRILDEDSDEFLFSGVILEDGGMIDIYWNGDVYRADFYDSDEHLYASLVSAGYNKDENAEVPPHAKFDATMALNNLEMIVQYPSKVFRVLDYDDDFVQLQSKDGKATIDILLNEIWDGPDTGRMTYSINRYTRVAESVLKEKTLDATDVQRFEMDIVRSDYEGISNLVYLYGHADYMRDGVPMHTICLVNRWYRFSDSSPFLYTVTLSAPVDMLEFYMNNYYYNIADWLNLLIDE